ncbi:MAG: response regulator transcription factor [Candidatus Pacebacteria bacterium]|nr:response regulator transcription factor [Candidatus Paceibacterota bacterium]MDR3582884.1 response regulator transcription factor [Candidatus Paceibacterota bacterium]
MNEKQLENNKVKFVVVEDHNILRELLRDFINGQDGWKVVGEAGDGLEAIRLAEIMKPDMMLLDLSMPRMNGTGAIPEIKKRQPAIKILVLTVHKTEEHILTALKCGADGYATKDIDEEELKKAIQRILEGKSYLSPSISEKVIEGYLEGRRSLSSSSSTSWDTLTQREREIFKMVVEGYKNKDIASYLCLSTKTVEKHRSNLMKKLNLHSVSSLTAFAMEKGLISR